MSAVPVPPVLSRPAAAPLHRDGAADFLKAFAILGVLLIHASTDGYQAPMGSFDWYAALFWGSISRAAVPIFLMVSGALMLDPKRALSLKKLWTRSLPRLLLALLFWAFGYQVYRLLRVSGGITAAGLWQAFKDTLLFHHEFHLYYLHIMLVVYALLPLTRLITAHADKRTIQYLLALWAVLGILYPTFKGVWPLTLLYGIPTQYALNMTYASVGYGLLGWYLHQYARSWKPWLAVAAAGFALVYGGTILLSLRQGSLFTKLLEGMSPGVALLAAGVCGAAFSGLRERGLPLPVELLSRASFCIFLLHVFFLYQLKHFGLWANAGPAVLFVPLTAAAVLACSLAAWLILSRIPVVNRWLI